jgi:hypothetical protein
VPLLEAGANRFYVSLQTEMYQLGNIRLTLNRNFKVASRLCMKPRDAGPELYHLREENVRNEMTRHKAANSCKFLRNLNLLTVELEDQSDVEEVFFR